MLDYTGTSPVSRPKRSGGATLCAALKMQPVAVEGRWSTQQARSAAVLVRTHVQLNPDPGFHWMHVHFGNNSGAQGNHSRTHMQHLPRHHDMVLELFYLDYQVLMIVGSHNRNWRRGAALGLKCDPRSLTVKCIWCVWSPTTWLHFM